MARPGHPRRTIAAVNRNRPARSLLLAAALLAFALVPGRTAEVTLAGPAPHAVDVVVQRTDGPPIRLQFLVAARDAEEAAAAARRASALLIPGAEIADAVMAQWAPWGWKWEPNEVPVPVAYNPTGAPPGAGPNEVLAGLQTWSSVPGAAFAFRYAGITGSTASILGSGPDGENVISWEPIDCAHGCVLGVTSKESGSHEVDMLLNSNPDAANQAGLSGSLDWRTVILHELGHMAGLEHSCPVPFGPCSPGEMAAVMHYQYRGVLRALAPDDIAGLVALYPAGAPSPAPSPSPQVLVVLEPGWNFLVFPVIDASLLGAMLPCLDAIYVHHQSGWHAWIRGLEPARQEITVTEPGRSYWVLAHGSCATTLDPAAWPVPAP